MLRRWSKDRSPDKDAMYRPWDHSVVHQEKVTNIIQYAICGSLGAAMPSVYVIDIRVATCLSYVPVEIFKAGCIADKFSTNSLTASQGNLDYRSLLGTVSCRVFPLLRVGHQAVESPLQGVT